mmetsp:Transcript_70898/g.152769  ORF Transcript_70898/g.152769 Transcript_70898/m.152769 type:complete len:104 (-) Transcript_70898:985-1296(-)
MLKGKVDALKNEILVKKKERVDVRDRVESRATAKDVLSNDWQDMDRKKEEKEKRERHLKDKLREALKIQETYRKILERLKEERSQFDSHLQNMQKSYETKNND